MTITEQIQQIISERNSLITALNTKGFDIPDDTKLVDIIDIVENTDIGGGGDTPSSDEEKAVNFYDYEGTLLYSYTRDEALALTELPALPDRTSENLTCQGWNWSLSDIQAELTNREDLDYLAVGANYITTDGITYINITMADSNNSKMPLMFSGNVTIDWGDGNTQIVKHTSAALVVTHNYAIAQSYPVKYTIKITVNSGTLAFGGGSAYWNLCGNTEENAITYSSRIDSVFIGNGIKSIGAYTFRYCYSLASVTIPNSVTNIGTYAFAYCDSLASISIPNSVSSIGSGVFQNCYSLASITIPNGVTSIGDSVFQYCYPLASVTIPNSVTSIGSSVFYYCYSLASVIIPNGVKSIGSSAFQNCYSLASITIPNGVTSIGDYAFAYCSSLAFTSITIPNSVTSIGGNAFNGCCGIIKYDFSTYTSVPSLAGTSAFTGIANDTKIVVPDDLYDTWITKTNWSTYKSYIVKVSEYIEPQYVSSYTIITYTDGSTKEINVGDDGILTWQMTKGGSSVTTSDTTIQSVEIGSDVTSIGWNAFRGCTSLTSVTIPEGVTSIGSSTFSGCSGLTSITIPEGVTSIGSSTFSDCSSLNDITFDKTMEEVSSMTNYPWGISSGKVIKCTDGNITISYV